MMNRALIILILVAITICVAPTMFADEPRAIEAQSVVLRLLLEAEVPAQEAGLLTAVNAQEGQRVKQGELLAQLDDRHARSALDVAESALAEAREKAANDVDLRYAKKAHEVAKAELRRSTDSVDRFPNSVSQSQLDVERLTVDKTQLEQEQADHQSRLDGFEADIKEHELAASRLAVERRKITAPFDGVVVQVFARLGEWVEPGQKVLRLVNVERLKAEGFIEANEAASVAPDTPIRLRLLGQTASPVEFKGTIVFVSPEVDPITNQVRLWAEVDNRQGQLRPGQPVGMVILAKPADELADRLPSQAE